MIDYMNIGDRLQLFIDHLGISRHKFEIECDLGASFVNKTVKAKSSINTNSLEKILNKYPNLNRDWLLTGNGEMLNKEKAEEPKLQKDVVEVPREQWEVIKNQAETIRSQQDMLKSMCERLLKQNKKQYMSEE